MAQCAGWLRGWLATESRRSRSRDFGQGGVPDRKHVVFHLDQRHPRPALGQKSVALSSACFVPQPELRTNSVHLFGLCALWIVCFWTLYSQRLARPALGSRASVEKSATVCRGRDIHPAGFGGLGNSALVGDRPGLHTEIQFWAGARYLCSSYHVVLVGIEKNRTARCFCAVQFL